MPTISEAGRKILRKWQDMGVRFLWRGEQRGHRLFDGPAENYSIPEQPVPDGWAASHLNNALTDGIKFSQRDGLTEIRISAQPIPKELLEMEEEPDEEPKKEILIHHIPERKLWLAQREAGTNEQWREINRFGVIIDIPVEKEPEWNKDAEYHPMFVLKPKTVKYYFCLCRRKNGGIVTMSRTCKDRLKYAVGDATIIGNIEERDVEV